MDKPLISPQQHVFHALSNSSLGLVDSVFPVEQRTVFGLGGEDSDLAVSLEWQDAAGCQWVADFTGENLRGATVTRNQISLQDSEGEAVCLGFYDLKPGMV
jgi:hypothetical protein